MEDLFQKILSVVRLGDDEITSLFNNLSNKAAEPTSCLDKCLGITHMGKVIIREGHASHLYHIS